MTRDRYRRGRTGRWIELSEREATTAEIAVWRSVGFAVSIAIEDVLSETASKIDPQRFERIMDLTPDAILVADPAPTIKLLRAASTRPPTIT